MAWVRYDDNYHHHHKVTALIAKGAVGVEAIGLHKLANTWTSQSSHPGFVPTHQPGVLVANPRRGLKLAALLVEVGLWEQADGGWVFHDYADYRPPASRQTPGTPTGLSAKRAAAGSKGGKSASRPQANGAANDSNASSKDSKPASKPCSPVVSSSELRSSDLTPEPVPTTSADEPVGTALEAAKPPTETQRANTLTARYSQAVDGMCRFPAVADIVRKAIHSRRYTDEQITAGLLRLAAENRPVTVDTLRVELDGLGSRRPTTTERSVNSGVALAERLRAEGR